MANQLKKNSIDLELAIVTVGKSDSLLKINDTQYMYYLIPGKIDDKNISKKSEKYWDSIIKDFNPDIIHLQGTEFEHALAVFKLRRHYFFKIVVSIQGLVHECSRFYFGYIPLKKLIRTVTFRDVLRGTVFKGRREFIRRGKSEVYMLKEADTVIGRTDWDEGICCKYLVKNYEHCGENLREFFYQHKWNYEKCIPYTIFCSQASYPIKGLHILLEALRIVVQYYPDVKLKIAGYNIMDDTTAYKRIKRTGYAKFLRRKILEYGMENKVIFLGMLSEEQIGMEFLKANCFVQSSLVENSPNSLGEAMMLGVPGIASFVGGTGTVVTEKEGVCLYPSQDYSTLALYIMKIFGNVEFAEKLSEISYRSSKQVYDKRKNAEKLQKIYEVVADK